jgi:hypothetical protein
VQEALDKMMVSPYREIAVDLVAPADNPDVVLAISDGRLWYLTEHAAQSDSAAVKGGDPVTSTIAGFALRPKGTTLWHHAQTPSIAIGSDSGKLSAQIQDKLFAIARYRNLLNVADLLAGSPAGHDLKINLRVRRDQEIKPPVDPGPPFGNCLDYSPDDMPVERVTLGNVTDLHHCDVVYVTLQNVGTKSVDLTVLYLDAERGINVAPRTQGGISLMAGQDVHFAYRVTAWGGGKVATAGIDWSRTTPRHRRRAPGKRGSSRPSQL